MPHNSDQVVHVPRVRFGRRVLACLCAAAGLLAIPDCGRADDIRLVAGEPTVLRHPPINDSVGNPVHCLTFLQDGASLATGATSGLLVWDTQSGDLQRTLTVDDRAVDAVTLDPGGTLLVAGGASGVVKVWNVRTWELLHTMGPTPGAVRGLSISPDGKVLATASPNGQLGRSDRQFAIRLWDLGTGQPLRSIAHPSPEFGTTALAFTPDGRRLVSAQDRTFRLVDIQAAEVVKVVEKPDLPRSLGSMSLRGDGRRLVTGVFEPKIRLWDTESWEQVLAWDAHDQEQPPRRGVSTVGFSPDGRYVLSGGMDGMVCVWDAASGRRLLALDARGGASGRWITGVVITPDNHLLAATHYGGTATLWRVTEVK